MEIREIMENKIPASENFESEENLDQNSNTFYGPNNYYPGPQPSQYNNYPYNAPPLNNGQYNPYSQQQDSNFGIYANYCGKNIPNEPLTSEELRKMQSVSIASIYVFVFWSILLIFVAAFAIAIEASYASVLTSTVSTPTISTLNYFSSLNVALFCWETLFGIFWAAAILTCGILGTVRACELSRESFCFKVTMILYIIGIFIPICQLIAACISLSKIKKYLALYQSSY